MKIFISYSSTYRDEIGELEKDLEAMGHNVWIDQELEGGHKWWDEILYQIRQCDLLLFAMSPESMVSEACRREYTYADNLGKVVLPVKIGDIDDQGLPEILGRIQYVIFTDPNNREMRRKLNGALAAHARRIDAEPPPLPEVTPPPMPYVAVDTIRTILQSATVEPSIQQQIYNELVKNRLRRESTTPVARELLLELTEHPSVKLEYRTKGWEILCGSIDSLISIMEKSKFLSPPLQSEVINSLQQFLNSPEADTKEKAGNLLRDMARHPAIQDEARGQLITLLCSTAEGLRYVVQDVGVPERSVSSVVEAFRRYLGGEQTTAFARDLLKAAATQSAFQGNQAVLDILCETVDGLIFVIHEFGVTDLSQSIILGALRQYTENADTEDQARKLLQTVAADPALQGNAQVIEMLCETVGGLAFVINDLGITEASAQTVIYALRRHTQNADTKEQARILLQTAATQEMVQGDAQVIKMLCETVGGLAFVINNLGITEASAQLVISALRSHTKNVDTKEHAHTLLRSAATQPIFQGSEPLLKMLCETVDGLAFVVDEFGITDLSQSYILDALGRHTKNADTEIQARKLLQSVAAKPALHGDPRVINMLCETVGGVAFVVKELAIPDTLQMTVVDALQSFAQNKPAQSATHDLLQALANNSAITGKARVKVIESLCQSMDGLRFIERSKQPLSELLQFKVIASLDRYVKENEPGTKTQAIDLLRAMRNMSDLTAEATLRIAKILLDSLDIIDQQLAQSVLPVDEQLDLATVLLNWPEKEYAEASKRLKQMLEREDLDEGVKTKYEEIYQLKEQARLESDPEYVRKKAYEYNDRTLWRRWALGKNILPSRVFFDLGVAAMLGVTGGAIIALLGSIVFGSWELKFPTTAIDLMQSPGWLPLLIAAVIHALVLYRAWRVELHLVVSVLRMILIYVLALMFTVAWTEGLVHLVGMGMEATLQKPLSLAHVIGLVVGLITGLSVGGVSASAITKDNFRGLVGVFRDGFGAGAGVGFIFAGMIGLVLMLVYGFVGGVIFFIYALLIMIFSVPAIATFFGSNILARRGPEVTPGKSKEESNSSKGAAKVQKELNKY